MLQHGNVIGPLAVQTVAVGRFYNNIIGLLRLAGVANQRAVYIA